MVAIEDSLFLSEAAEQAEAVRDPTHVRHLTGAQLREVVAAAGLRIEGLRTVKRLHNMDDWLERAGCRGPAAERVRELLADRTRPDGVWVDEAIVIRAVPTGASGRAHSQGQASSRPPTTTEESMESRPATVTAKEVADALALQPHPEGGYFRETYRSSKSLQTGRGERSLATAILFLVAADRPSRFHRLTSDELWVYQAGAPLELLLIDQGGTVRTHVLGAAGAAVVPQAAAPLQFEPQVLAPAGVWQAARLAADGDGLADWALVTCVVTPGFDYQDFELAERDALIAQHPHLRATIVELT